MSAGTELKRFRQGKLPKIAIAVLLFIPLIYGALYLWAFWAPTDHMNQLPVAVVNSDKPALKSDGSKLTAGDDIVNKLIEGADLKWKEMSAEEAKQSVADGDVYFAVTIPKDFSETLAGLDTDPKAGRIEVTYNDTNSFLASTLGKQAMVQVRSAVAETTTKTAADQILVGVEKLSDGTRTAADAAEKLDSGATKLSDGSTALSAGLGELADGTAQLVAKAPELTAGSSRLADGLGQLETGSGTLAGGADRVAGGTAQLAAGSGKLADGAGTLEGALAQLSGGATTVNDGAQALAAKLGELKTGTANLDAQTGQLNAGAQGVAGGAESISQGLAAIVQLSEANPNMTLAELNAALGSKGTSLQAILTGAQQTSAGAATVAGGTEKLTAATAQLSGAGQALADGGAKLSAGTQQLATGAGQAQQGSAQLAQNLQTLTGKAGELSSGAAQVSTGAATLHEKTGEAAAGGRSLADGATKIAEGGSKLNDGAQKAHEGSMKLDTGVSELKSGTGKFATTLEDGAAKAPTFTDSKIDRMADTIATPVKLDQHIDNEVQGFGGGFAPFFMALASFVGALITWLILRALPRRPLATGASGLRSVLTGFWPAALIAVGQVAIMMAVLVWGLGLEAHNLAGTTAFLLLTTLSFLALQQMFIVLLGSAAGRVVSLVLLMLQLSSSGGTYPVETTPGFFQALHPFMPASYVVTGLRQMIGGGVDARFWIATAMMAMILIVSLAISAVSARKQKVWTVARMHPELVI